MDLNQYINDHTIIKIGSDVPGHQYADIIVDNPPELIELLDGSKFFISAMLWWERTPKGHSPKIGAGGVVDPRHPSEFYFAETFLNEDFEKTTAKHIYFDYIHSIHTLYPEIPLYPSFDIELR